LDSQPRGRQFDAHWWGSDTLFLRHRLVHAGERRDTGRPHEQLEVVDKTIEGFNSSAKFALVLAPKARVRR
jgi:hypothetical protein